MVTTTAKVPAGRNPRAAGGYGPARGTAPTKTALRCDAGARVLAPGPRRHNIAEIALHRLLRPRCVQISGVAPFVPEGDDWRNCRAAA